MAGTPPEAQILDRILREPVRMTIDGKVKRVTTWDAIAQVIVNDAELGEPVATNIVLKIVQRWSWLSLPEPARCGIIMVDD